MTNDKRIIVVSYGSADKSAINASILLIEKHIMENFPDYSVCRAFTGDRIRELLKEKYNMAVDNTSQAIERALKDGIRELIILPTHISCGSEYHSIYTAVSKYNNKFKKLTICDALTASDNDLKKIAFILTERHKNLPVNTAVLYIGHGTEAGSDIYIKLQDTINESGFDNIFITTLADGEKKYGSINGMEKMAEHLKQLNISECLLYPLMIVTGRHAALDIGGDDSGSWRSVLQNKNIKVDYINESLCNISDILNMFSERVKDIIN